MATEISVVIPMFNEAKRVDTGISEILEYLSHYHPEAEVLLIDDGSRDGTPDKVEEVLLKYPNLQAEVVSFGRNRGKGAVVREGMRRACGRVRMFADADNATPIEELDHLLPLVDSPRTIVIGSRALSDSSIEKYQPWWRQTMGKCFNAGLSLVTGLRFHDTQCGFKLFGAEAAETCFANQTLDGFAFDVEVLMIAKANGFAVREVPVRWRHIPESRVHPIRDSLQMAFDVMRVRFRR